MQPAKERMYYLLKSYTEGTASEEEKQELYARATQGPDDDEIKKYIKELVESNAKTQFAQVNWENMYRKILEETTSLGKARVVRRRRWISTAAAVFFLVLGGVAVYLFISNNSAAEESTVITKTDTPVYKNDVGPGGTKAVLSAGGRRVLLSSADTSFTLAGNKVNIDKGDVRIAEEQSVEYTLNVPRGGTYSLVLADGTKVWLNAESRLIYPSVFAHDTRKVTLTGEAYFKVTTDAEHPFVVKTNRQEIKALGTEFNVKAYPDEEINTTTLVQGKVVVHKDNQQWILRPGEQLGTDRTGKTKLYKDIDIPEVVAWKNGYFRFDRADLNTIMRSLARWYDISVKFDEGIPKHYFGAIISRDNNISKILKMLEATGDVHFEIDGKTVNVSK